MYVAVGTTSDGFKGAAGAWEVDGCCANCRPVREFTDEYVDSEDWARLCDSTLEERGFDSSTGDAGKGSATAAVAPLSESRRLLVGKGLAPLGRATRFVRRSDRYEAIEYQHRECTMYSVGPW